MLSQATLKSTLPPLLSLVGLVLAASSGVPPAAQRGGPSVRVIDVQSAPGYFNEPAIAVNPANPAQLVAAYQVNASAAYSTDSGDHWTIASGTAASDYKRSGDVSVAYDSQGHALLCFIAFDKLGTPNYWAHNATRNGIFVRRSLDGGRTWEAQSRVVLAQPTRPGIPFEDKPYIVTDTSHSRNRGNVYVGWTEFRLSESVIFLSRSLDDGLTWSSPVVISDRHGLPRDDTGAVEGFTGAVADNGTLHVVWSDGIHIVYASSMDGGRSFTRSRNVADTAPSNFQVNAVYRSNGYPQIAFARGGPAGHLYITWSDYRNGDVDVFCIASSDAGRTWSAPMRVNDDPLHNGADQFFQWMATDPSTGAINVVFYDRRADPDNRKTQVVLARSTDFAHSFVNQFLTDTSFDPQDTFLGDYTGLTAFNGRVYAIWSERRAPLHASSAPRTPNTVVRIAVADFNATIPPPAAGN